ncbi:MAG TPA: helix-turn-helix domain-containing protein [Ktedonobacteraceae bacterium]|nr:helix-turn-helix domain-containing protein [Ktedonobacteraceae bacterium]
MEEMQPHTPTVMSIQQVAAFLGVSRQHVYKLIHDGLPVVPLGRRVVVLRTSLEEWLLTQQKTTSDL